ncbi:long-chain-fatty-acid-CoA ligase [Nitzschia inconspicua]|uniref:Long-chain-fatty-acid-CoA ligase n=1 Tax=Nitzschia inconspicua TaxID=303405 RepID=A0A9K3P8D8_9STRA|nr:long-chain-fatty-acid-CoA ligase [Nitzschia inconspicua]KAG7369352.1 long-chain-fatty-acid-CoA ligase [Nitzschia inconspicua]
MKLSIAISAVCVLSFPYVSAFTTTTTTTNIDTQFVSTTNRKNSVVSSSTLFVATNEGTDIDKLETQQKQQLQKDASNGSSSSSMTPEDEAVLFGHDQLRDDRHPPFPLRHRKTDRSGNLLEDKSLPLNTLEHSTSNPLINKLHTMRESKLQSCPQLWQELALLNPNQVALIDEHLCDDQKIQLTFAQMNDIVDKAANVFQSLGIQRGQHVAILGENSARWLQVDHGIQRAGGASAVRGADAPLDELRYIYEHSDSAGIVVLQGPQLLKKLFQDATKNHPEIAKQTNSPIGLANDKYGPVKHVILMHREKWTNDDVKKFLDENNIGDNKFTLSFWDDLVQQATPIGSAAPKVTRNDLATIVYTSGTTGRPKGVMLTHGNLLHQTSHRLAPSKPYEETEPLPGETMVSLLPVWHITERSFEIWMLSRSCKVVYSSIRTFRNDMAKHQPEWLVLVPRVLEKIAAGVQDKFANGSLPVKVLSKLFTATGKARAVQGKLANGLAVGEAGTPSGLRQLASKAAVAGLAPLNFVGDKLVWSKVKAGFGGKLKTIISGGSSLAGSLEQFYETAGFNVIVGYGLTECAPLLSYRRLDGNLVTAGCCGKPCMDTEVRVVDPESKATAFSDRPPLPDGEVGVVIGRGPQIMKGYYKNPEATAKAIDEYGWFDTGDLGRINPATGDLILTGRAKDTIVLSNGENIEPQPLEDAILGGTDGLVEQVMLTGQDGRRLVAILVLSPTELANAGYLSKNEAEKLQKANEVVNDPKCEDCEAESKLLQDASTTLRKNTELQATLINAVKTSTSTGFARWEQVSTVYLTMEPFAMANGQLTQSYKVKRDSVLARYGDELPK